MNADVVPIRRALVSVHDKTGLANLASGLCAKGVAIVSTGSTANAIRAAGVPVTEVSEVTGFPELLDGRVHEWHRSSPVGGAGEQAWAASEAYFRDACAATG